MAKWYDWEMERYITEEEMYEQYKYFSKWYDSYESFCRDNFERVEEEA